MEDLRFYVTGSGKIFDPNPAVTSGNAALTWNDTAVLTGQTSGVTLERLKAKRGGKYRLDGTHVLTQELSDPAVAEPASAVAKFEFAPTASSFLSVMAYFHIDRFRAYLQDALALTSIPVQAVEVDANVDGDETWAGDQEIRFGAGGGPGPGAAPDATDALVIVHEYGHVLQAMIQSESVRGNWPAGITEGFGDFLAAVYFDDRHQPGAGTRGFLFPWSRPAAQLRDYRVEWKFGGAEWQQGGPYEKGQLWCTTMFEVYRKLGGDSRQAEVREGARDNHLYVLVSGTLGVVRNCGNPDEVTLFTLSAGDLVGELSFIDGTEHYASLIARGDTQVFGLEREQLESLLATHPDIVYRVMRAIVRTAHQIQRRISMYSIELTNYIYKQHGRY